MTIQDIIHEIAPCWHSAPGASQADIDSLAAALGRGLPDDYREFLAWSDGGEGWVGDLYFAFWATGQVIRYGDDYRVPFYVPGVVAVGDDSGPTGYALDYRADPEHPSFIKIPLDDLGPDTVEVLGGSMTEALGRLLGG